MQNHGNPTSHKPELILTNFTTRLGHRVGRCNLLLFDNLCAFLHEKDNRYWSPIFYLYHRKELISFCHAMHVLVRLIASLFPQDPNFRGRRVVTFHNQRDFIFFRHHRYGFIPLARCRIIWLVKSKWYSLSCVGTFLKPKKVKKVQRMIKLRRLRNYLTKI